MINVFLCAKILAIGDLAQIYIQKKYILYMYSKIIIIIFYDI